MRSATCCLTYVYFYATYYLLRPCLLFKDGVRHEAGPPAVPMIAGVECPASIGDRLARLTRMVLVCACARAQVSEEYVAGLNSSDGLDFSGDPTLVMPKVRLTDAPPCPLGGMRSTQTQFPC